MSKVSRAKSLKKRIAEFRLTAARVILGNLPHIPLCTSDMRDMADMAELCEQYSLLIALNWIATRYGFPVCAESMRSESVSAQFPLLSWASLANRYPLSLDFVLPDLAEPSQALFELMDRTFPTYLELIGEIYQQVLSAPLAINDKHIPYIDLQSDARASGEFYTPAWVADNAFEQWLSARSANSLKPLNAENIASLYSTRILDPSCGCGNFLLAAARLIYPASDGFQPASTNKLIKFVSDTLYGRDIDGRAIELTKILLTISALQQSSASARQLADLLASLDRNIRIWNSLLDSCAQTNSELFDLVITNPPYISFGARDQQRIASDWQAFLKARFPASSEYKLRFTSMFQEIGIELLKKEGHCIFLVPDAFLTGSFYQRLRRLICQRVEIVGLTELNEGTISGATVGRWCLAHYKKNDGLVSARKQNIVTLRSMGIDSSEDYREFKLTEESLISKDKHRFQLLFSQEDLDIVNQFKDHPFLKECIRGHTGIRARNGQASIVAPQQLSKSHFPGLISGSELCAFNINWQGNFLEIVPERLFSGGFDPEIISNPKILVRQTGDRLIAAADDSGFYHLNNVHSFSPVKRDLSSIYFYTCLLNSSFFLYFYRLKTREHKRALAQIDIETVEHMPLPKPDLSLENDLNKIGRVLSAPDCSNRSKLLKEMDQLIYKLFEMHPRLQAHIAATIT